MTLEHTEIEEANHFAKYVLRILPKAMAVVPPLEESQRWPLAQDEEPLFVQKTLALVQEVIDQGRVRLVMHILVLLKSLHHNKTLRVEHTNHRHAHDKLDLAVRGFVEGDIVCPVSRHCCSEDCGRWDHSQHGCNIRIAGLRWYGPPMRVGRGDFWDFASAFRALKAAYLAHRCSNPRDSYDWDEHRGCFHTQIIDLLDWLEKKAWAEVRLKVLLLTGKQLPAELAERAFECVLEAEGIASQPGKGEYTAKSPGRIRGHCGPLAGLTESSTSTLAAATVWRTR